MKKKVLLLLVLALTVQLFACGGEKGASPGKNLMADIIPGPVIELAPDPSCAEAAADFAIALLQNAAQEGETTVISPYSVLAALSMTANGAAGLTAQEFETVFGMSQAQMNLWLYTCASQAGPELVSANALWINETVGDVREEFLQINADYYNAAVYQSAFDEGTVEAVNAWVSEHTSGRIPTLLNRLDASTALLLVNALTFDAKWDFAFENDFMGTFTAADGTAEQVTMMNGIECFWLEDENATGFVKNYENEQYSFVALLPKEGVSLEDYLSGLTGAALLETIAGAQRENVFVTMPKLELATGLDLCAALQAMGLTSAFGSEADFSAMSENDLMIGAIAHQTALRVNMEGTEAAAATGVVMTEKAMQFPEKQLTLDRPFLLAIVDNATQTILFLGTVNTVG